MYPEHVKPVLNSWPAHLLLLCQEHFPVKVAASFSSLKSQLKCHLPQEPSDHSTQNKPSHPPSQQSHHASALFSLFLAHVTVGSYFIGLLVYLFIASLFPTTGRGLVSLAYYWSKDSEKPLAQSHWCMGWHVPHPRVSALLAHAGFNGLYVSLASQPNTLLSHPNAEKS